MVQILRQQRFSNPNVYAQMGQAIKQQADQAKATQLAQALFGQTPLSSAAGGPVPGAPMQGTPLQQAANMFQTPEFAKIGMLAPEMAQEMRAGALTSIQQQKHESDERLVRAGNIYGTAQGLEAIAKEDENVEQNMRSFLETKMMQLENLKMPTADVQQALAKLETDGPEGVLQMAKEAKTAVIPFLQSKNANMKRFSKGQTYRIRKTVDGEEQDFLRTGILDSVTGDLEWQDKPLDAQLISELSETAQQQTQRKVGEKTQIEQKKLRLQREDEQLTAGLEGADRIPKLIQAIDLLQRVRTGGFDKYRLQLKRAFGIESEDEALASATLARQILAQLRPIFGSQFTEREGTKLEKIEPSIDKGTQGNLALLEDMLDTVKQSARRGRRIARGQQNESLVEEFDRLLDYELPKPETRLPDYTTLTPEQLDLYSADELKTMLEKAQEAEQAGGQ